MWEKVLTQLEAIRAVLHCSRKYLKGCRRTQTAICFSQLFGHIYLSPMSGSLHPGRASKKQQPDKILGGKRLVIGKFSGTCSKINCCGWSYDHNQYPLYDSFISHSSFPSLSTSTSTNLSFLAIKTIQTEESEMQVPYNKSSWL